MIGVSRLEIGFGKYISRWVREKAGLRASSRHRDTSASLPLISATRAGAAPPSTPPSSPQDAFTKSAIDAHGAAVKHCADGPTAAPAAAAAAVARSISPKLSHLVRVRAGVRVGVGGWGKGEVRVSVRVRVVSSKLSHLVRIWVKVRVSGVRVRVIGSGLRLARTLTLTLAPALALT